MQNTSPHEAVHIRDDQERKEREHMEQHVPGVKEYGARLANEVRP